MKPILIAIVCLSLAACMAARPNPNVFETADTLIQSAEAVGGDEFAPVEMRFAREKLASARLAMEKQKYEVNAELAIEKSRTAKSRREVNELRKSNEDLEEKLRATFGDEF